MVFEARFARGKFLFLIVACVLFAAAGVWITGQVIAMYDPHPMVGWVIAAASAGAALIFYRRIGDSEPQLRLDEFGIAWKPLARRVAWNEVAAVAILEARPQRMLMVTLDKDDPDLLAGGVARTLAKADKALGLCSFGITMINLDRRFDELLAAVRHFRPDLFENRI